jgi:hypothetical protein
VAASPAGIGGIPLAEGEVGIAYTASLSASGGPSPYAWSVDSGSLPAGLNLAADGSISGTPTAAGTFGFTIRATDATNQYTTRAVQIKIAPALAASLTATCASVCSVEQGCVNVCGIFGQQTGGVGPFAYSANGNIPGGMKLNGLSLAGSFPNLAQFWQFTVTITDSLGATAKVTPTFYVYAHIRLSGGTCLGNYITGCSVTLKISGGNPNGKSTVKLVAVAMNTNQGCWVQSATAPPPGYVLADSGGYVTVAIPKQLINGYGAVWTLVVTDGSVCGANASCSSPAATVTIGVQCG